MEEITTWESAAAPTDAGTPAPEVEQPAESLPLEAEPALETDAPLIAEEAARGGESQQVEDVHEDDTPEILALPSGSASRRWARQQFKDAQPTRTFLDYKKPIGAFADDLEQRSQSRYAELVDDIAVSHADYISHKLFGLTAAEAKARLSTQSDTPTTTTPPAEQTAATFTEAELNSLDWEVADRIQALQQSQAQKETELQTANEALQRRLDALEGKFTTREQAESERLLQTQAAEAQQIGRDLYDSVWTVVEQGIKDTGLEIGKDDPERIASLKRAAHKLLAKRNVEDAFDEDPENVKLVESVMAAANRRERDNAFREEDNLKMRARAAFERVKTSPEVKAILDEIASFNSKSHRPRTVPAPPVPGASAGITAKPPANWDEAVAGAAR